MTDNSRDWLDELLDDAARTYNRPPDERAMPLDSMWREIDAQVFGAARKSSGVHQWLRIAAALLIGIGIGRLSLTFGRSGTTSPSQTLADRNAPGDLVSPAHKAESLAQPLDPATSKYLAQASALLVALPTEVASEHPDHLFTNRANELLLTTRLLLDSPASEDPSLHNLLEDLELVLVQVVQLEESRDRTRQTELELIRQALEQRDVIPRLRNAAFEYASDN